MCCLKRHSSCSLLCTTMCINNNGQRNDSLSCHDSVPFPFHVPLAVQVSLVDTADPRLVDWACFVMLSVVTLKHRLLFYFPITVVPSRRQSPRPLNSQKGSYFWSLIGTSADPSPSGKDRTFIRMNARLMDLAHPLQWAKIPWESHQGSRQPT